MPEPTPLADLIVNDRFWLKYARTSTENASKAWRETASKLLTAVGWFWTVYTSVALLGVGLTDREIDGGRLFFILVPIPLLSGTYLLALRATSAIAIEYDPRSPDEIKAEFVRSSELRRNRVRIAVVGLVLAALSVMVAGAVVGSSPSNRPSESSIVLANGSGSLLVEVRAHKESSVTIRVQDANENVLAEEVVTADEQGRATLTVSLAEAPAGPLTARGTWTVDDVTFSAELRPEP